MMRSMTSHDIAAGLRLCRASGWNQLENDWRVFLEWEPAACRVAERGGKIVGTVSGLRYGHCFSWLSMLLVDPAERGAGIGTRLFREGLGMLGDDCVRLDATPFGHPIYARSGFVDEYPVTRVSATVDAAAFPAAPASVRVMRKEDLADVLAYDRAVFGADRGRLLRALFQLAPAYAWITGKPGDAGGYCFGRPGFLYDQLGPIVVQDDQIATNLVSACLKSQPAKTFVLDVPQFHPAWLSWLEDRGFSPARSFVRMRRGENNCPGAPDRMYAIAGPEFG